MISYTKQHNLTYKLTTQNQCTLPETIYLRHLT
jgi:hypothetical protein